MQKELTIVAAVCWRNYGVKKLLGNTKMYLFCHKLIVDIYFGYFAFHSIFRFDKYEQIWWSFVRSTPYLDIHLKISKISYFRLGTVGTSDIIYDTRQCIPSQKLVNDGTRCYSVAYHLDTLFCYASVLGVVRSCLDCCSCYATELRYYTMLRVNVTSIYAFQLSVNLIYTVTH